MNVRHKHRTVRATTARAAAPEGGALHWVRGCALCFYLASVMPFGPALAQDLPSGQSVELYEVLLDQVGGEDWVRFRFLAPEIARDDGSISYAQAEPDMAILCDAVALPYVVEQSLAADKIAISLSDRETEFGLPDPEATQFIEVYRPESGRCIWEAF